MKVIAARVCEYISYFFMVPPGEAASPFLSTAPAVPAPCVLASFGDGLELPLVAFEAGTLACGLPPGALACASAAVLANANAVASEMDFIFIVASHPVRPTNQWWLPAYVPASMPTPPVSRCGHHEC